MPRSQVKLTAALAGLVVLVTLASTVLTERRLREMEREALLASLEGRARLVAELSRAVPFTIDERARLDALADRAAAAARARVTLIDRAGNVLGDSQVPLERLASLGNHSVREEFRAALEGGVGRSGRRSETIGRELFYLAVPVGAGREGVVRLAVDAPGLPSAVSVIRRELLRAGAIGLVAALALSYALSWLTLRSVREIRSVAASIARGRLQDRVPFSGSDELAEIGVAINQMAEQLRLRLADATHEKDQLQAVLESMVEGVLVVDARGVILLANSRLCEFYDVRSGVEGRPYLEAIRSADLDAILSEAARSDEIVSRSVSVGVAAPRTLRVQAVRFPAGGQDRAGTVAVFHDITELMRLEEVRRDFVANASHELRTPLAAVRGFAETLLANESLPVEDRRRYLEIIERHSARLGNLVGDLLELSKIESRKTVLHPATVDVAKLAGTLIRDAQPRFDERELEVRLSSEGDPSAWADAGALEQILSNLLANAAQYTDPGGWVRVEVEGVEQAVRVRVRDSGIGIPEADLSRIFERFYRVDEARSRAVGGTGLGLSIVKHLVQRMGGEIRVESELGKGTAFIFTLPRPVEYAV